jgi:hypothetical protein
MFVGSRLIMHLIQLVGRRWLLMMSMLVQVAGATVAAANTRLRQELQPGLRTA